MMRRVGQQVSRRGTAAAPLMLAPAEQNRTVIEVMSTWWLSSWMMCYQWQFFTFFPLLIMDWGKPQTVSTKVPLLHFFEEKKTEARLQQCMGDTVTVWSDEIDNSAIDSAIQRGF